MFLFSHQVMSTLYDSMDCSMPDLSVPPHLPEFAQVHVHWINDASNHLILCCPLLLLLQSSPASGSFPMSRLFASGGQSTGTSASASVLPMSIQGWFPLGLAGLISLLSKDSQESSPVPQFKSINSLALSLPYGPTLTSIHDCWLHDYMTSGHGVHVLWAIYLEI